MSDSATSGERAPAAEGHKTTRTSPRRVLRLGFVVIAVAVRSPAANRAAASVMQETGGLLSHVHHAEIAHIQ